MIDVIRISSRSPEQTRDVGVLLAETLRGGDVLALSGPLGAGKTQFVKGVAAGLRVPKGEPVVSPTYVLVREYAGRLKLFHIDAYRLASTDELFALGVDEMLENADAIVAIEWADRVREWIPSDAIRLEFEHAAAASSNNQPGSDDRGPVKPDPDASTRFLRIHLPDATRWTELARRLQTRFPPRTNG